MTRSTCGAILIAACAVLLSAFLAAKASAGEPEAPGDPRKRIEALEKKVEALERQLRDGGGGVADASEKDGEEALRTEEPRPLAGIEDNRPFLQSADGRFRVEIGGRIQARYTFQGRDVNRDDREARDRSWAELERARIRAEGHLFDPRFFFRIEWDGHTDKGELGLTDTFIQYRQKNVDRGHEVRLGVGQWKPFFGRQEKQSAGRQLLVDRSLANQYFSIDRNIGIWIEERKLFSKEGAFNAIGYELGVTNGIDSVNTPPGEDEFDNIPALIAHLDLDVFGNLGKDALVGGDLERRGTPGLTVGTSLVFDANDGSGAVDPDFLEYRIYQMAYDFVFKHKGFSLNGEYFGRWLDFKGSDVRGGEGGGRGKPFYNDGGYIEASYMLTDRLQAAARASGVCNRTGPVHGSATEVGGGLNYFIYGHNLKLSTDLLYIDVSPSLAPQTEKLPGHPLLLGPGDTFESFSSSSANLSEFQGVMLRVQLQLLF